jgi:hypothetical protein
MPVGAKRFERTVSTVNFTGEAKLFCTPAYPFPGNGLIFAVIVIRSQVLRQVRRTVADYCHREHGPSTKTYVVNCPGIERFGIETQ